EQLLDAAEALDPVGHHFAAGIMADGQQLSQALIELGDALAETVQFAEPLPELRQQSASFLDGVMFLELEAHDSRRIAARWRSGRSREAGLEFLFDLFTGL